MGKQNLSVVNTGSIMRHTQEIVSLLYVTVMNIVIYNEELTTVIYYNRYF